MAANNAQANAINTSETFASAAANAALAAAEAFSSNGSNISSGTVPAARLPLIGNLTGVVIQADPGGTPSGSPGQMFFYY